MYKGAILVIPFKVREEYNRSCGLCAMVTFRNSNINSKTSVSGMQPLNLNFLRRFLGRFNFKYILDMIK